MDQYSRRNRSCPRLRPSNTAQQHRPTTESDPGRTMCRQPAHRLPRREAVLPHRIQRDGRSALGGVEDAEKGGPYVVGRADRVLEL